MLIATDKTIGSLENFICLKGVLTFRFLLSEWDYWGNRSFISAQDIEKNCLKLENPYLEEEKKLVAFLINVSSGFSSSLNSFHRYHLAILIFVIIHVEKTFRAITGLICGKDFKKK